MGSESVRESVCELAKKKNKRWKEEIEGPKKVAKERLTYSLVYRE